MKSTLSKTPSRDEVLKFIFKSSTYGNLGLFIGAGFSKAILNNEEDIALSWGDLLKNAASEMRTDYAELQRQGASYPEMASTLCRNYAEANGKSFDESVRTLKRVICAATAWYPGEPERSEFANYLKLLAPSWIVTTNYDQVLECLLSGKSLSLGPGDAFSSPAGVIPILHLHGLRTDPKGIIITQEDYIALFRPAEYRQIRLALTIKESTTCLLGYGLGDVNVLTALDWSKNVYEKDRGNYPHEVIQVVRTENPTPDPYRSTDGIVILEASEISEFCKEYAAAAKGLQEKRKSDREKLKQVIELFAAADPTTIKRFIDDDDWRRSALKWLANFSVDLVGAFESFLEACFKETRRRSGKDGAFHEYATDLDITLDILTSLPPNDFPPALLPLAATNLDRLASYIGTGYGYSWAANNKWNARKAELSTEIVAELRAIALQHHQAGLKSLLERP